jgi:hypothetical protein
VALCNSRRGGQISEEGKTTPNVYIEPRPKGRKEGEPIEDYVVEDHKDHVLKTFKTQKEAIDWAISVRGISTEGLARAPRLWAIHWGVLLHGRPQDKVGIPPAHSSP